MSLLARAITLSLLVIISGAGCISSESTDEVPQDSTVGLSDGPSNSNVWPTFSADAESNSPLYDISFDYPPGYEVHVGSTDTFTAYDIARISDTSADVRIIIVPRATDDLGRALHGTPPTGQGFDGLVWKSITVDTNDTIILDGQLNVAPKIEIGANFYAYVIDGEPFTDLMDFERIYNSLKIIERAGAGS